MAIKIIHKVTFYSPCTFISNATSRDIDSWDLKKAIAMADKISTNSTKPYCFFFSKLRSADPIDDGEGGTLNVEQKLISKSGQYFIKGKVVTFDEIMQRANPKEKTLLDNMRINEWPLVVFTNNGCEYVQPWKEDGFLVSDDGEVIERGDDPKYVNYREQVTSRYKMKSLIK